MEKKVFQFTRSFCQVLDTICCILASKERLQSSLNLREAKKVRKENITKNRKKQKSVGWCCQKLNVHCIFFFSQTRVVLSDETCPLWDHKKEMSWGGQKSLFHPCKTPQSRNKCHGSKFVHKKKSLLPHCDITTHRSFRKCIQTNNFMGITVPYGCFRYKLERILNCVRLDPLRHTLTIHIPWSNLSHHTCYIKNTIAYFCQIHLSKKLNPHSSNYLKEDYDQHHFAILEGRK